MQRLKVEARDTDNFVKLCFSCDCGVILPEPAATGSKSVPLPYLQTWEFAHQGGYLRFSFTVERTHLGLSYRPIS